MKGPFANFPLDDKRKLVLMWKKLNNIDKEHFINQVTYAMATWGFDKQGKELVAVIIEDLIEDGSLNLSDFGLYAKKLIKDGLLDVYYNKADQIKKAIMLMDSYRLKHELSNIPSKSI